MEKMYVDTASLRKQMMVKHAELAALYKAEKPDQNAIQAMQKELNALGDQVEEKMTAFQLEAKKIAPDFDKGIGHRAWGWAWASAQVLDRHRRLRLLAANDPGTAQELLNKTENGGKALPLWDGDWPRRFFLHRPRS